MPAFTFCRVIVVQAANYPEAGVFPFKLQDIMSCMGFAVVGNRYLCSTDSAMKGITGDDLFSL